MSKVGTQYIKILMLAWTGALLCSLVWNLHAIATNTWQVVTHVGRSFFQQILLTRAWNAGHGGVYVRVTTDTQPNPYLLQPDRDVTTTDGVKLTKINPAYMTRQIAELATQQANMNYHITSLKPLRPENRADAWETQALRRFETGNTEQIAFLNADRVYRYMAPLLVDKTCLPCHAVQGYQEGDIRGGISVTIPAQPYVDAADASRHALVIVHLVFWGSGLAGLNVFQKNRERQIAMLNAQNRALEAEIQKRNVIEQALTQAKTAAEAANHAKSEFLANISHEIRTPMNAILGFIDILLERIEHPQYHQYLASIRSSSTALLKLLNDILDLSRMEAARMELRPEPVYLEALLREIKNLFLPELDSKQVQFQLDIHPSLPKAILIDRIRLKQILINLIGNAIKFTSRGHVRVALWHEPSPNAAHSIILRFDVEDTGIGMTLERQAELFAMFPLRNQGKERQSGGIGMGLSMTKRLIDVMHGTIAVTSQEGQGSLFRVSLPDIRIFEEGVLAASAPEPPAGEQGGTESFLASEDLASLSADVKVRLPELVRHLENTTFPVWQNLCELLIMGDVVAFARSLQTLSGEYPLDSLQRYAQLLSVAATSYNVTTVESLLKDFPTLLAHITRIRDDVFPSASA